MTRWEIQYCVSCILIDDGCLTNYSTGYCTVIITCKHSLKQTYFVEMRKVKYMTHKIMYIYTQNSIELKLPNNCFNTTEFENCRSSDKIFASLNSFIIISYVIVCNCPLNCSFGMLVH